MKKTIKTIAMLALILGSTNVIAQNAAINSTGSAPDASAMLDISSTTKGLLTPRMTAAQRGAISSPATGLIVYQTDGTDGFYYYDGSSWILLINNVDALPAVNGSAVTNLNASNLASGTVPTARLGSGTADNTTYLRGDGAWATPDSGPIEVYTGTTGGSISKTVNVATRTVIVTFNGGSGAASTINLTFPSASNYTAGTIIYVSVTSYITANPSWNVTSSGDTYHALNFNGSSMTSGVSVGATNGFRLVSDGVSKWYRVLGS